MAAMASLRRRNRRTGLPFITITPQNDPRRTSVGPIGVHPSTGEPILLACGCVPVQSEAEEKEIRTAVAGVVLAGTVLAVINLVLATVEGVLGAEAEAARQAAIASGVAARLEAQGLSTSSTTSNVAALLGAFGADLWQVAVAFAVLTASMAVLAVPLTVTALVRKSRRLTRLAQGCTSFTTLLMLIIILVLGAVGHLSTRDNAGLTALYIAQGLLAVMTLGSVALRLEALVHEPAFWLFAKTQAIDLGTEVMLEMERRREEEEERVRRELEDERGDGDGNADHDGSGGGANGATGEASALHAFFASSSAGNGLAGGTPARPTGATPAAAAAAAAAAPAPSGAAALLAALQGAKQEEARQPDVPVTTAGVGDAATAGGYMSAHGYPQDASAMGYGSSQPNDPYYGGGQAAAEPIGAHWRADGSYVDEHGGVTDAYQGYTWPDGAGYTDSAGYFYASDGYGGFMQQPSEPPAWSMAAQQQQQQQPPEQQAYHYQQPQAVLEEAEAAAETNTMRAFGFEPAGGEVTAPPSSSTAAATTTAITNPPRLIQRADEDDDDGGDALETSSLLPHATSPTSEGVSADTPATSATGSASPAATPSTTQQPQQQLVGASGPDDKLLMPASAAASAASSGTLKPSIATTSAISRIRKMAPKRILLPQSRGMQSSSSSSSAAAATAAGAGNQAAATAEEQPPPRFPLF